MKGFKQKKFWMVTAWALCVAAACGAVLSFTIALSQGITEGSGEYVRTSQYDIGLRQFTDSVMTAWVPPTQAYLQAQTDDYVDALYDKEVNAVLEITGSDDIIGTIEYFGIADYAGYENLYDADTTDIIDVITTAVINEPAPEPGAGTSNSAAYNYQKQRLIEILAEYEQKIQDAQEYIKAKLEREAANAKTAVAENKEYMYYFDDGAEMHTNIGQENPKAYITSLDNTMARAVQNDSGESVSWPQYSPATNGSLSAYDTVMFTAMRPDLLAAKQADYTIRFEKFNAALSWTYVCGVLFLAAFTGLMWLNGSSKYGCAPSGFDRIYLDVGFALWVGIGLALLLPFSIFLKMYINYHSPDSDALLTWGITGVTAIFISAFLIWATSLARRIRKGRAYTYTLIYKITVRLKELFANAPAKSQARRATALYFVPALIMFALSAAIPYAFFRVLFFMIFIILSVLFLIYLFKQAGIVMQIQSGVERIGAGDPEYVIPANGKGPLYSIADGINGIAGGMARAVKREVKAERMKTELITNISHDLKTPLTSILTYTDLLKKEPGLPENAKKYAEVLDAKSRRLKILTDDLFDAAKAASGDMAVECEKVELAQFMEQAFAETEDRINDSTLTFITEYDNAPIYVTADGRLLYRVISNVFDNAVKYSAKGSRVYVSIKRKAGEVWLTVKNVSAMPLNITADKLTERFVRGDSSRNTEGSGLGLSIARDFMKLMGGSFLIEIDGDLFKANIIFNGECGVTNTE